MDAKTPGLNAAAPAPDMTGAPGGGAVKPAAAFKSAPQPPPWARKRPAGSNGLPAKAATASAAAERPAAKAVPGHLAAEERPSKAQALSEPPASAVANLLKAVADPRAGDASTHTSSADVGQSVDLLQATQRETPSTEAATADLLAEKRARLMRAVDKIAPVETPTVAATPTLPTIADSMAAAEAEAHGELVKVLSAALEPKSTETTREERPDADVPSTLAPEATRQERLDADVPSTLLNTAADAAPVAETLVDTATSTTPASASRVNGLPVAEAEASASDSGDDASSSDEAESIDSKDVVPQTLRDALNSVLLRHLEAEGISESLVRQLRSELRQRPVAEPAKSPATSEMLQIFQFGTDCSMLITASTRSAGQAQREQACDLRVGAGTTVGELKHLIEERLQIPAREQTILQGESLLEDCATLATCKVTPRNSALTIIRNRKRMSLSGSTDGRLKLWTFDDEGAGSCTKTLKAHDEFVTAVSVDWFGMQCISGSEDGIIKVWDLGSGNCTCTLEGHDGAVNSVDVDWHSMQCISGSNDFCIKLWDLRSGQCKNTLKGKFDVWAVVADWSAMQALSGSIDSRLHLWNLESGECAGTFTGHKDLVTCVVADWRTKRALSGSFDKTLRLWEIESGKCLRTFEGHGDSIWALVATWTEMRAVSGAGDSSLRLWDLSEGQCLRTLTGHSNAVRAVAMDWDLQWVVSGSRDRTVRVWNIETGECKQILKGHSGSVQSLALY